MASATKDSEDIIDALDELTTVVDAILEASVLEIEDLVIDVISMILAIKDGVEALGDH